MILEKEVKELVAIYLDFTLGKRGDETLPLNQSM